LPEQTLAVGDTLTQKWGRIAWSGSGAADPDHELWLILSPPKNGKTYLQQSNPNAFIFNFDGSPCVFPGCPAGVWPIRHGGRVLDSDGRPIILDWPKVIKKKKELIRLAETNAERPSMIVFDTVTSMSKLLIDWIPTVMAKPDFTACGQAGWRYRNDVIVNTGLELMDAGYGVTWCVHLVAQKIAVGDQVVKSASLFEPDLSDGLWQTLQPYPSVIARLAKSESIERPKDATGKLLPGNPIRKTQYELRTYDPAMPYSLGTRLRMPETIILPSENPWQAVLNAIKENA